VDKNFGQETEPQASTRTAGSAVETTVAVEFIRQLHARTKGDVELRALPSKDRVLTRKPGEIAAFLARHSGENLYFGAATRVGGGTAAHCRELPALFCDVDDVDADDERRIESFVPAPSIVNATGGGRHVLWLLDPPLDAHDPRAVPILRGLAAAIGADPACAEIARVLRVPGTFNHKPKYDPPRPVFTLREDWSRRHTIGDFAEFLARGSTNGNGARHGAAPPIEDIIPEGQRRTKLLSVAGSMRRRGAQTEEILAALRVMNARRCKPPLAESDLADLAEDVASRYMPNLDAEPPESVVADADAVALPDMPETVLDGRLGEILRSRMRDFPIAYAWPALLAAASVRVAPHGSALRTNLNVAVVGPVGTGKTQAIERARRWLGVGGDRVATLKAGSAEELLDKLGDQSGGSLLLCPDELSHLLEKAQLAGASFAYVLNSLFYSDGETLTIAHGKVVNFNCRLSIVGGIIDDKFDDSFGSATTGGLYDRFLFGQCPSGFEYLWRPVEGSPACAQDFELPCVSPDVWEARDEIANREQVRPRILEIALRSAFLCAAADGRAALRAADLAPAWELARYQARVRLLLQPNAGKNFEGRVAHKILTYLERHAPRGEWIAWRKVRRDTRADDYGPPLAERTLHAMCFGGTIEEMTDTVGKGQKRRLIRLAGESS
jgi:DNA primase RepB-like protein/primase-like protein